MRFLAEISFVPADPKLMKNAYFVILVLIFLSLAMVACVAIGESGAWRGHGSYEDQWGTQLRCERVEASFFRTEFRLEVAEVRTECGSRYWSWGPAEFEVHGNRLVRGGDTLGEIDMDRGGWFSLEDPQRKLSVWVRWERDGDQLRYTEEVFTAESWYRIRADLYR